MYDRAIQSQQFCRELARKSPSSASSFGRHYDNDRRVLAVLGCFDEYLKVTQDEFELASHP